MVNDLYFVYDFFKDIFPYGDSTEAYPLYNVFCATSPDPVWYQLLQELKLIIRNFAGHNDPLWMQAWLNYHTPETVLGWHGHDWPIHGYININPFDTETQFEDYTVKNKIGNIYIGPGHRLHKVNVKSNFIEPRLTIGFDVHDKPEPPFRHFSLMPL